MLMTQILLLLSLEIDLSMVFAKILNLLLWFIDLKTWIMLVLLFYYRNKQCWITLARTLEHWNQYTLRGYPLLVL